MNLNKKGFTLIELIASMVILAMLMVVTVPNVIGILAQQKKNAYKEDAGKLISTAKYKFNQNRKAMLPAQIPDKSGTQCVIMSLGYLNNSEFENGPNEGKYDVDNSFVVIVGDAGETVNETVDGKPVSYTPLKFEYYVRLDEELDGNHYGIKAKGGTGTVLSYENIQKGNFEVVDNMVEFESGDFSPYGAQGEFTTEFADAALKPNILKKYDIPSSVCSTIVNAYISHVE